MAAVWQCVEKDKLLDVLGLNGCTAVRLLSSTVAPLLFTYKLCMHRTDLCKCSWSTISSVWIVWLLEDETLRLGLWALRCLTERRSSSCSSNSSAPALRPISCSSTVTHGCRAVFSSLALLFFSFSPVCFSDVLSERAEISHGENVNNRLVCLNDGGFGPRVVVTDAFSLSLSRENLWLSKLMHWE